MIESKFTVSIRTNEFASDKSKDVVLSIETPGMVDCGTICPGEKYGYATLRAYSLSFDNIKDLQAACMRFLESASRKV